MIDKAYRPLAGLCILTGIIGVYLLDPAESRLFMPCPFHWATGLYCPGCGTLRGLHRLFHGDIAAAFALNPLMVVSIPFLIAMTLRPAWTLKPWVAKAWLVVIVLYWILRNIPVWPLTILAPH